MSLTWVSAAGTELPFDGSQGVTTVMEAEGIFNLPVEMTLDPMVSADGAALISERRAQRRVVLRLLIEDSTSALNVWRTLVRALAAGGELVYDNGVDTPRTLRKVRLESPDRSMTGQDLWFRTNDVIPVSLIALDPWWYGPPESLSGSFDSPTAWNAAIPWDSAIPWNGGTSVDVVNVGDGPAVCTVVVEGPATSASFSVNGMGGWESEASVSAGEYLSVSSEPDRRGPHRGPHGLFAGPDGPIDWSLLTESSQLFELPAGSSSLVFGASGTDGDSAWTLQWYPRYLTP